jgi:hypothetical protein
MSKTFAVLMTCAIALTSVGCRTRTVADSPVGQWEGVHRKMPIRLVFESDGSFLTFREDGKALYGQWTATNPPNILSHIGKDGLALLECEFQDGMDAGMDKYLGYMKGPDELAILGTEPGEEIILH